MRFSLTSSIIALAFALPALSTAAPIRSNTPRRPDLNAFVNHAVVDTKSLVAEVNNNPEVADRYERLFGMSKQQVLGYLSTLHREPLANATEFTVYSAPEGAPLKRHQEVLKKGTPIFADSEGRPKLIVKCGNPIGFPPTPQAGLHLVPPTSTPSLETDLPAPRDLDDDATDLLDAMPIVPEVAPLVDAGPADFLASTLIPTSTAVHSALPFLGLAPLLAPIFGSSGHGGTIVVFPTPEPAPFVALGLGAVAMVRRRRRKA